jgi:glycosyltransferase involved in cell wall biosynthesis
MRIVYYSKTAFFDVALCLTRALSKLVEVHFFLELSPTQWNKSLFSIPRREIASGVLEARSYIQNCFPTSVVAYWKDLASFNLVVHSSRGANPATWLVSHKAMQTIQNIKPDLIHLEDLSLRLIWTLPEMCKFPILLSVHDSEPHYGERDWRFNVARKLMFSHIKHFILFNRLSKDQFIKKYKLHKTNASVVNLGVLDVYTKFIKEELPEEEKTILFFGRISPYKGLDVLIESAKMVCNNIHKVRFIIAGHPIKNYKIPTICELPNNGLFEVHLNHISNFQLACLLQRASIVVCPYIEATQSAVILTAYAFRKPVIATMVGGLSEYVWNGETGFLVPPKDPQALADAIIRLIKNDQERERIKMKINERNNFDLSWDKIANDIVDIYKNNLQYRK